ncbi:MAG: glutamate--tRNA ligase, partial [Bacteroidales bacterium]|nr:glutamate--tRNA ligase [Bacteroidales bacterium]
QRCSKAGAKFDYEKGKWFNHQYMLLKDNMELAATLLPELQAKGIETTQAYVAEVLALVKGRMNFLHEFWANAAYFFQAPQSYDEKTVSKRWKDVSAMQMGELEAILQDDDFSDMAALEAKVAAWCEEKAYGMGVPMNAFRLALVGEGKGPHIFDITRLIGKAETLQRLRRCVEVLG